MDDRHGGDVDHGQVRDSAEPQLGQPTASPAGAERTAADVACLPTRPRGSRAVAAKGISKNQNTGAEGQGRNLLWG